MQLFVSALLFAPVVRGSQVYSPDEGFKTEMASLRAGSNSKSNEINEEKLNVLFIMTDQQRFDMIGAVQNQMAQYTGKTKVYTPNLDKLMNESTSFMRHYTQNPSCAPARSTLATGCTIERTGIQTNEIINEKLYSLDRHLFGEKVRGMRSFEQILSEEQNYNCEYYGKWHRPQTLYYQSRNTTHRAIQYNSFDFRTNVPTFDIYMSEVTALAACLDASKEKLRKDIVGIEQVNSFSGYPYTPTKTDSRYGYPGGTEVKRGGDDNVVVGRDSLQKEFTSTHCIAVSAINAMDRLISENKPWSLVVSFNSPHPPTVSTGEYFDKYWDLRNDFFVPPSIDTTHMKNSAYKQAKNPKIQDVDSVKEWMVSYYALVEEVDHHVGQLLDKLDEAGQTKNTLVIFTSDHGESLGSHGRRGKGTFYEESIRIPLMIRLPDKIPQGKAIDTPTASIDVFSTILDYTGNKINDRSDGMSLRRFIDDNNSNNAYDNEFVVSEMDNRNPTGDGRLTDKLGSKPNFMVVKNNWKLMIPKSASSNKRDQMYNIAIDPFEMNNLLGHNGASASKENVGKAEHLKVLLHEWLERMNGNKGLYSNPVFNAGEGHGDIAEVESRRTWRRLPIWVSDMILPMGKPAHVGSLYVRNEYLYIGRTTHGNLSVNSIVLEGTDSHLIKLSGFLAGSIKTETHKRVIVTFQGSHDDFATLDARIRVSHSEGKDIIIELHTCHNSRSCHDEDDPVGVSL